MNGGITGQGQVLQYNMHIARPDPIFPKIQRQIRHINEESPMRLLAMMFVAVVAVGIFAAPVHAQRVCPHLAGGTCGGGTIRQTPGH